MWLQVIIYVDDANDEVPVFTQQQYNRLGLRETAGIGTSVIVVRATDRDMGESIKAWQERLWCFMSVSPQFNLPAINRKRHSADCGFKHSISALLARGSCLHISNPTTTSPELRHTSYNILTSCRGWLPYLGFTGPHFKLPLFISSYVFVTHLVQRQTFSKAGKELNIVTVQTAHNVVK